MATVKIVLRNKPNKEGLLPLVIRITKNRKSSEMHLGYNIKASDWDEEKQRVKKSYPNSVRLNNLILKKLSETTDTALELETKKSSTSASAVKQKIRPSTASTFFPQAELYLDTLKKAGKHNRWSADKPRVKHFKEFTGGDIAFDEITVSMLERYKAHLKSTRNISDRTINNHLVLIRSVFSQAINDKIVDKKDYPFGKGQMKIRFPDSGKTGLTKEEVQKLENVELPNERQNHSRNLWLFSYYNAGMRASDVMRLQWNDVQDGRISYVMGKNDKGGSLKLPEKAVAILDQYRQDPPTHGLVFPDLKGLPDLENDLDTQRRIKTRIRTADDQLKFVANKAEITKNLTMHLTRHTFAQIAGDKIPIPVLQRLYRHTHISTTIGYQNNFIHHETDTALETVLNM